MEDQNYHQSIQNQQQWQLQPYQDQEQVWQQKQELNQENQQHLRSFQWQRHQHDPSLLQQQQPQQYQEHQWQQQPLQDQAQQWHQQDPDQQNLLQCHWQQRPQKDHPEHRLHKELDHPNGYQQHLEENYGQMTNTTNLALIQEEHDQQLAVAFNRGQEQHSQKLTLAFIQEEEDQKLAVALFQEDQDRKLAVALTQEEQDRLLALSLIEKITKQTHLQDQRLLFTSNNEFEPRTRYETNRQDLLEVNVDHESQQDNQYYMGVQDTFCLSSSYTQDFGPISEIVQQVVEWLTGRSQQISDRFSAIPPPVIRERNNDKKETNIEDFLGKFSKTSKEVKCWFSVEKSNIAGTETKGQFCGQKSKIVDPALIHPSPTHPPPSYEDQYLIKDDSKMHLKFHSRKSPIPSAPPLEVPLTYETVPSESTKGIYQDDRRSSNQIYDFEQKLLSI